MSIQRQLFLRTSLFIESLQKHLQLLDHLGIPLGLRAGHALLPGPAGRIRVAQRQLCLAKLLPGN